MTEEAKPEPDVSVVAEDIQLALHDLDMRTDAELWGPTDRFQNLKALHERAEGTLGEQHGLTKALYWETVLSITAIKESVLVQGRPPCCYHNCYHVPDSATTSADGPVVSGSALARELANAFRLKGVITCARPPGGQSTQGDAQGPQTTPAERKLTQRDVCGCST